MGLKTNNYTINGYDYPEVYAVFNGEIRKFGNDFEVGFNIHASRELALSQPPLKVVKVRVSDWDRKSDLVAVAYQKGKEKIERMGINPETGEYGPVLVKNVFTDWEDDIVNIK